MTYFQLLLSLFYLINHIDIHTSFDMDCVVIFLISVNGQAQLLLGAWKAGCNQSRHAESEIEKGHIMQNPFFSH